MDLGAGRDAVVVGGGPNGLAAAVTLARAGRSVLVVEAETAAGGGARTAELTLPAFRHDVCSAIHPMGLASPFFRSLAEPLEPDLWLHTPVELAHPLDGEEAVALYRSVTATSTGLGADARSYKKLVEPLVRRWQGLLDDVLRPMRLPSHPFLTARFGLAALRSCRGLVTSRFEGARARALFAGCTAHSMVPLDFAGTAAIGLMLIVAGHAVGWPCVRGGSQEIVRALEDRLARLGGELVTGWRVRSLSELPPHRAVLLDLTPRQVLGLEGLELSRSYRRRLGRFRYGPGSFKIDWALDGPIPWRDEVCRRAATVHVGGTFEEIAAAESAAWEGRVPERPFVLVAQQSLVDPTRAPDGKHTGWGYCHVPHGAPVDMTQRIEAQIERFAPGFRDRILARHTLDPVQLEEHDANFVGGDIGAGANTLWQFLMRPVPRLDPYSTPAPGVFLCSSSTPPGGGVHGMCGYQAARSALRRRLR